MLPDEIDSLIVTVEQHYDIRILDRSEWRRVLTLAPLKRVQRTTKRWLANREDPPTAMDLASGAHARLPDWKRPREERAATRPDLRADIETDPRRAPDDVAKPLIEQTRARLRGSAPDNDDGPIA